ncbi:class I adenylate-forming enzyme family protein [Isoptericola sp. NPDC057653]|uniref:class I adenylate-forming enzyme family protein n=1 Tax=unclassified Isoptericola TaxID=2623355 RepID=UPI0036C5B998
MSASPRLAGTLPAVLRATYERHADAPALWHDGRWLSFAETARVAAGIRAVLAERGAGPGDRVVVHLGNGVTARLVDQALLGHGLVRVAVSARLHVREVAAIAADSRAAVVCGDTGEVAQLRAALREVGSAAVVLGLDPDQPPDGSSASDEPTAPGRLHDDDVAMLMYTSGTTGDPKAAVVTQGAWAARTRASLALLPRLTEADTVVLAAPMAHFAGSVALDCLTQGARTVVAPRFDADAVLDLVQAHDGTVVPLVPVLLARLVDAAVRRPTAGGSLRSLPYGGSAVGTDTLVRASRRFPGTLTQFYGLAEALAPLTVLTPEEHDAAAEALVAGGPDVAWARGRLASAGRFVDGVRHRVDDGELAVRGPAVMPGYWGRPDLDAEVLRDGWFATGDRASIDDDGYLRLAGRGADAIASGGFTVHPREVERVLERVTGVADVAVAGVPDPRWGEAVHAFVVVDQDGPLRDPEVLAAALRDACTAAIASYKKPRQIHVRATLPRNHHGKVDRRALRASVEPEPVSEENDS